MRLNLTGNNKGDKVTELSRDDCCSSPVGLVADEGKDEDDHQGQRGTDSCQGICRNSIEALRPERQCRQRCTYLMIDGVYVVRGAHVEKTAKVDTKCNHLL